MYMIIVLLLFSAFVVSVNPFSYILYVTMLLFTWFIRPRHDDAVAMSDTTYKACFSAQRILASVMTTRASALYTLTSVMRIGHFHSDTNERIR